MKLLREIFENHEYEVIIAGSGPAGIAAAINAGRSGVKTLLIESQGRPGGIATTGYMSHWTGTVGNKTYWEILRRHNEKCGKDSRAIEIDPDLLTITYMEMLEEANVDCLLYTDVFDVIMEENCVKGVVCCNKNGLTAYTAKVVIDATGDGDLSVRAGASYTKGDPETGKNQAVSLRYLVSGIDTDAFGAFVREIAKQKNGRGAYVCDSETWIKKLGKAKLLNKAFSASVSDEVYDGIVEAYLAKK